MSWCDRNLDLIQRCTAHGLESLDAYDQARLLTGPFSGARDRFTSQYWWDHVVAASMIQEDCRILLYLTLLAG